MKTATKKPKRAAPVKAIAILEKLGACGDARELADGKTAKQAWETCERGNWMLWAAGAAKVDRKLVVQAACDCARLALKFVPAGEDRPRIAIETAERWVKGEATLDEVRNAYAAANAAYAAAYAAANAAANAAYAAANAAANAAYAAAYAAANAANAAAANAAYDANAANAANAAYAAASAAYAAAYAANAAYAYAARTKTLKECAALVRKRISFAVMMEAVKG
jgi:hypothetical protein